MYPLVALLASVTGTILIFSFISQAYASQLTVFLSPQSDSATAVFTGVKFITLKYDPGSALSQQFNGKAQHIRFAVNSTDNGMSGIISAFNQDIANEKQSPVRINNATLQYTGDVLGEADRVLLSYKIDLTADISNYVLQKNGPQGSVIDLDWRSISVNQPLVVDTPKYGKININYPIGLIQVTKPELAQQLLSSPASAAIMQNPILDFKDFGQSMDSWHFLFDPTGSQAGAAGVYREQGGARAVSVYALGESSLREGTFNEAVKTTSATINGQTVSIESSTPPPSAQIQISGFSKVQKSGNSELAFVSANAPEGTVTATGGFPLQVLLVFGGMMGAVAVFVLIKARK